MISGRLVHRITDSLPDSAWQVMISGFRTKKKYRLIALELARMGFHVSERTIAKRAIEWRSEQLRREAMRATLSEAPRTDLLEEAVAIIKVLDTRPGWALRGRRRVQKAVASFLDAASPESAQAVRRELLRFRLETLVSQARGITDEGGATFPAAGQGGDSQEASG